MRDVVARAPFVIDPVHPGAANAKPGAYIMIMSPPSSDVVKARLLDAADMSRTLDRLARQVVEHLEDGLSAVTDTAQAGASGSLALVGIQTRGVYLARRIRDRIDAFEGISLPLGALDATFYRDDVLRHGAPAVQPTDIPFDVDGKRLVLVDDVVYTGRTTRAALDALLDLGRPAGVKLLVLIDRGLRELPVSPDFTGKIVPTAPGEEVRVRVAEEDGEDGVWLVESKEPVELE